MAGMELEFVVPPADLQPYISLFYRFQADVPVFEDVERAQTAQFRWRLSPGETTCQFVNGHEQIAPPYHVLGPTTGAMRTRTVGPLFGFGFGLTPAGWAALVEREASAMADSVTCGIALFGDEIEEIAERLRADGGAAAMVDMVAPFLRRRLQSADASTLTFVRAVDAWLAGDASPELDDLAAATGLSRRHIERRCNALYGAPPKFLARKYRALRAAVAMVAGDEVQLEGFYDQSHMIREVKHFTGLTPKKMRDEPGALAALTIRHRRALEGQVGPLVSKT